MVHANFDTDASILYLTKETLNEGNNSWKYIIPPNHLRPKAILKKNETTYDIPKETRWHVYFSNVDKYHLATNSARRTPATVLELFAANDFVVWCLLASGPYEIVLAPTESMIFQGPKKRVDSDTCTTHRMESCTDRRRAFVLRPRENGIKCTRIHISTTHIFLMFMDMCLSAWLVAWFERVWWVPKRSKIRRHLLARGTKAACFGTVRFSIIIGHAFSYQAMVLRICFQGPNPA